MSRALTHNDAYALINAIAEEATGQKSTIQAQDLSSFVSVGETILNTGMENTLNAISIVLGRTLISARPYSSQFKSIRAINSGIYSNRLRKISFYSKAALPDGSTNTQLFTNLANGFDNGSNPNAGGTAQSTASMWEQHQAMPAEFNFAGSSTWQDCITKYEDQVQMAFRGPDEFNAFVAGFMTEKANDIETQKEAFDRIAVLNYIAGIYDMSSDMPGSAINFTAAFNDENGTSYTTQQLLTTYQTEFYEFFVAKVKELSDLLADRSANYHWGVSKTVGSDTYTILRHSPKKNQKMMLLSKFWTKAEAQVKPQIFNTEYLDFGKFEAVKYWQNENDVSAISVTPAIPDTSDPTEQTAGDAVALDYVLGLIYDEEALMTDYQLDDVSTTPKEARKHYRNTWFTFRRNAINDFTEKGILMYMAD